MCDANFKSSHPKLRWPRTDATPSYWPETGPENKNEKGTWFEKCSTDHPKYNYYAKSIGKYLALKMGLPNPTQQRIDMPKGYGLFCHYQPRAGSGEIREDFYLYGSPYPTGKKFRSVPEFERHAWWLMDTSRPLDDHTTCECQYNKQSELGLEKKMGKAEHSAKRALDDDHGDRGKRQRTEGKDDGTCVPERAIDYRSQRRYRRGELVFFRIETISPPAGSGLPEITHWPGLISNIVEKTLHEGQEAEASLKAAWTMFGAAAPDTLQKTEFKRQWSHSIRALGMFATGYERHGVLTSELLPWSAGVELLGGSQGWAKIAEEGLRILNEGVRREAKDDPPKEADLLEPELTRRWKSRWGERVKFDQMDQSWDAAVLRLAVGLRTGKQIAESWTQTDKIMFIPPHSSLTPQDIDDLENNRKSLFQGVWLRGERIWCQDMVRIRKHRADLPVGELFAPSKGAVDRGVFLHIRTIALETLTAAPGDESAVTPTKDGKETRESWRCVFYGDVFELAEGEEAKSEDEEPSSQDILAVKAQDKLIKPKAPKGYHYRCLNSRGNEVLVDVFDIAGRCYPDLMDVDSAWFYPPGDSEKKGRAEASDAVMSLTGLRPCVDIDFPATTWKDDLYVIVRDAQKDVERDMRVHYGESLSTELNYRMPDYDKLDGKTGTSNGNGNANGNSNGRS